MNTPDSLAKQATLFLEISDLKAADRVITTALQKFPSDPNIKRTAGLVRMQQGRLPEAVQAFQSALDHHPADPDALNYMGECLYLLGDVDKAKALFEKTVDVAPEYATARTNLGTVALEAGFLDRAEEMFQKAIAIDASSAPALLGLGNLADGQGRYEDALQFYAQARDANPMFGPALHNLSVLEFRLGHTERAMAGFDDALEALPDDPKLLTSRGVAKLMLGDWAKAWEDYENRLRIPPVSKNTWSSWLQRWDGRPLTDDGIVVWMEQGVGDFIVALHALPELQERVVRIVLACDQRLEPVLRRSLPDIPVIAEFDIGNAALKDLNVKYQMPAFDLIRFGYPSPQDIPNRAPWLICDQNKRAAFRAKYEAQAEGRPIVGISWQSRKSIHQNDSSVTLQDLQPALEKMGGYYVSLQYGETAEDIAAFQKETGIEVFQDPDVDQLKDMAALVDQVAALDSVLAAGSTVVHVAGALHIPVTVLNYEPGDGLIWHRFRDRSDSPWYPSMNIIRWSNSDALQATLARLSS